MASRMEVISFSSSGNSTRGDIGEPELNSYGESGSRRVRLVAFIRLIADDSMLSRMSLPDCVTVAMAESIQWSMRLATPGGNIYEVKVINKGDGRRWLKGGWATFVRNNGLELGDILAFLPNGKYQFQVRVFSRQFAEVNYAERVKHNLGKGSVRPAKGSSGGVKAIAKIMNRD